jgi:hypothetical protein
MPSGTRSKPAAMYGITRGVRGWKVSLTRNGVVFYKHFGFRMHQGEAAALLRAQTWRDGVVKKHPPKLRREMAQVPRSNNTSGIPGVRCATGPDGMPRYWHAETALAPGKKLTKCFSVGRYGADAKQLAIAERQRQLLQMTGLSLPHPDEAHMRAAPERKLPSDCPAPVAQWEIVRSSNTSGVAGVKYRQHSPARQGFWAAVTRINGNNLYKSFAVKEHGYEGAKALAIAERHRQLKQVARLSKRQRKSAE